jgi:HD-GYP domain-containing protein (c-di-GMP phosphodiesterase class II)
MKILIIEPDKYIQSMVESVLNKNSSNHQLTFCHDMAEGKILLTEGNIDFLVLNITDNIISDTLKQLKSIAKKLILTKALIITSDAALVEHPDFDLLKDFFKRVDHIITPLSVIRLSSTIMDILTETEAIDDTQMLYLPVKIYLLKNAASVPCDVYVKISEKKYVKIINKNQEHTVIDTVDRYEKKGIEVLYVEKDYYSTITHLIVNDFFSAETDALPQPERGIQITESIMMVTSDMGVSQVLIDSINNSYTEVIKNLENEKVSNLLASLSLNQNMFIVNHSYLTSVFAVMLCQKMEWANTKIQNNLCMAALLHDLVLADNNLGQHDRDDLDVIKKLPPETRDLVLNHPKILADKLSNTTNLPSDVISLISKHHEGRGKDSYPRAEYATQLSPVNCLFNVAHQFSIELYKIGFNNAKLPLAFANLREYYKSSSMRSFVDLLEQNIEL